MKKKCATSILLIFCSHIIIQRGHVGSIIVYNKI